MEQLIVREVTGEGHTAGRDREECVYLLSHGVYEANIKVLLCSDACRGKRKKREMRNCTSVKHNFYVYVGSKKTNLPNMSHKR